MPVRYAVLAAGLVALAGCTSSGTGPGTSPPAGPASRSPLTGTSPATSPVAAPPTRAVAGRSCPYLARSSVRNTLGMRLGRQTLLRSGAVTVGCRFYALQGSPLHNSEHLPGPHQPVPEVRVERYPTTTAAHNAFVLAARTGRNPAQLPMGAAGVGVCYQTGFYPKDRGRDWACGASLGRTRVLVRSVDTTGTFSTATLTREVLRHV